MDTIWVYKGSWSNVDDMQFYADDYMYLLIEKHANFLYQEKTIGHAKMTVVSMVDYFVDSLNVINFTSNKIMDYYIAYIEDANGNIQCNIQSLDESRERNCLNKLFDDVKTITSELTIYSRLHGFEVGKTGTYTFVIYITTDNIECFTIQK